ncbi:hypothetical protein MMC18_009416 [Xylographa bjoerkii]|nr:hypothetical protein [Xylographa bjoerkii]
MEAALVQTVEDVSRQLVKQRGFATALESFQQQLLYDLEHTRTEGQSHLARLVKDIGSATQNLLTRITSATSNFEANLAKLADVLHKTNDDAVNLDQTIGSVFRQAAQRTSELAEAQTKQWDDSHGLAVQLQNSLESISSQSINELLGALSSIQNQLQSTNHLILAMHGRQDDLSDRLNNLDNSFESLETKAHTFSALQTAQAEALLHLYNQMQVNIQSTSERLAVIDASASSIDTKISNLSSLLAQLSNLFTVLGSVSRYWWQVLLLIAVAWFSRRLAAYSAVSLFSYHTIFKIWSSLPADMMLTHHASGLQVSISTLVMFAGVLALLPILYIITKHLHGMPALKNLRRETSQRFSSFASSRVQSGLWTPSDGIVFDTER